VSQSPQFTTSNAKGNLLPSATIAANGNTTFNVDVSGKFKALVQVEATFGTFSTTAGLQIDIFRRIGSGPQVDSIAAVSLLMAATASTTQDKSFALPPGRYQVKLTNLDATNSVTSVTATDDTWDSVG
jgi:hypothetical protein